MQQATTKHVWTRIQPYVVIGIGLVVLLAVVRWGGTARPGPLFVAGTALVIGVIGLFGMIGAWLYLSSLPPGVVVAPSVSSEARRLVARGSWQGLAHLSSPELLLFMLFGSAIFAMLQVGITEWNSIDIIPLQLISGDGFKDAFWSRSEWLYPVVVTALGLWSANLALHATRRAGAATVVALLVALGRTLAAVVLLRGEGTTIAFQSFWFVLPPAIALDLWYARRLRVADSTQTLVVGNVLAIAVGLLVNLPIIASTMVYPRVNLTTIPWMIGMSLLVGLGAGWAGAQLGAWLASRPRTDVGVPAPARSRVIAAATGLLAAAYTLVVLLAARPPMA